MFYSLVIINNFMDKKIFIGMIIAIVFIAMVFSFSKKNNVATTDNIKENATLSVKEATNTPDVDTNAESKESDTEKPAVSTPKKTVDISEIAGLEEEMSSELNSFDNDNSTSNTFYDDSSLSGLDDELSQL